jgi:acetolactate synthase-1/2/3 large subunit
MHQERNSPARVFATDLKNPDFCALALAYGAHGERVERTEEFAPALARAIQSGKPALIHCLLDPQAITPTATLDSLRAQGLATAHATAAPLTSTATAASTASSTASTQKVTA